MRVLAFIAVFLVSSIAFAQTQAPTTPSPDAQLQQLIADWQAIENDMRHLQKSIADKIKADTDALTALRKELSDVKKKDVPDEGKKK